MFFATPNKMTTIVFGKGSKGFRLKFFFLGVGLNLPITKELVNIESSFGQQNLWKVVAYTNVQTLKKPISDFRK